MITTLAKPAICRCGAVILTGYAEGLPAKVDPAPINSAGHIAAIITGRWVYSLQRDGLVHLNSDRIGTRFITGPILAEHKCGHTIPESHREISAAAVSPCPEREEIPF